MKSTREISRYVHSLVTRESRHACSSGYFRDYSIQILLSSSYQAAGNHVEVVMYVVDKIASAYKRLNTL